MRKPTGLIVWPKHLFCEQSSANNDPRSDTFLPIYQHYAKGYPNLVQCEGSSFLLRKSDQIISAATGCIFCFLRDSSMGQNT